MSFYVQIVIEKHIGKKIIMNKKLDDYLCNKYPKIFVERSLSPQLSCLGRGLECGNGWIYLLDGLFHHIQQHIQHCNEFYDDYKPSRWKVCYDFIKEGFRYLFTGKAYKCNIHYPEKVSPFVATQIKEKFGCLRIYHYGGDEYCQTLLSAAEYMSYYVCETCGKFGQDVGRTEGWIQSICKDCAVKHKRQIKYIDEELHTLVQNANDEDIHKTS